MHKKRLHPSESEEKRKKPTHTAWGRVITHYNRRVLIEDAAGVQRLCALRSHIIPLVAGDAVQWQAQATGQDLVVEVMPRVSVLGRPDTRGRFKAMAANITHVIVVVAPEPMVSWELLDRCLAMAEQLNVTASIVLNKTDLPCQDLLSILETDYVPLGYPVILTQQDTDVAATLGALCRDHVSVMVGQSGVGKSSLMARLLPDAASLIRIGPLTTHGALGSHTTRNARFYPLPQGGALIDSPGVRQFGLWEMSTQDIAWGYREFRSLLQQCQFRDCTHLHVKGCAVLQALEKKQISARRYENYVKIVHAP